MSAPRKSWSEERKRDFARAWESGVTIKSLRTQFSISNSMVQRLVRDLALKPRPSPITYADKPAGPAPLPRGASTLPPLPSLRDPL